MSPIQTPAYYEKFPLGIIAVEWMVHTAGEFFPCQLHHPAWLSSESEQGCHSKSSITHESILKGQPF